jgi:hypothetical protein
MSSLRGWRTRSRSSSRSRKGPGRHRSSQGHDRGVAGAGLSRESLYQALSDERTPSFDTILEVVGALGIKLHAEAATVAK